MKSKYLLPFLVCSSITFSLGLQAAHHEKEEINYKEGQKAVIDAFGWDMKNPTISTERITDNLHVLFGNGGNILVSTGDDGVLLVDDQMPEAKNVILRAIRKLGGRSVDYIINTHWHFDHAEGNNVFGPSGAQIIAQENSRYMMLNPQPINLSLIVYPQQPYPIEAVPEIT